MNFITINGSRDSYGFRHFSVGAKNEVAQDPKLTDKPLQLNGPKPSEYSTTIGAKIWRLFKRMVEIIGRLFGLVAPHVYQGLYEEILLNSSSRPIHGGKESEILWFLYNFLKKEATLEKERLNVLHQAAQWAEKIEKAADNPKKYEASLQSVADNIALKIKELKYGSFGLLIPGGPTVSYYVKKFSDNSYRVEVLTRHPELDGITEISVGGRSRVNNSVYTDIPLSLLNDPEWLKSLLKPVAVSTSIVQINGSLTPLQPYLEEKERNHLSNKKISRFQNLWDLAQQLDPTIISEKNRARSKLMIQVEALFGYFDITRERLAANQVAFDYLKEGLTHVSRNVLTQFNRGHIDDKELALLSSELDCIKKTLEGLEKPQDLPLPTHVKSKAVELVLPPLSKRPPEPITASKEVVEEPKRRKKITPYQSVEKTYVQHNKLFQELTSVNAISRLKAFEAYLKDEKKSSLTREHYGVNVCLSLPFAAWDDKDVWLQLSAADRVEASQLLTSIGAELVARTTENGTNLPNRALSLIKLTMLCEYLARLNQDQTGVTLTKYLVQISDLKKEIQKGKTSYQYDRRRKDKSANLGMPSLRFTTSLECGVFEQIEKYQEEHEKQRAKTNPTCEFIWLEDSPSNIQRKHLVLLLNQMHQLLHSSAKDPITFANVHNQWGPSFENPILEALSYAFVLEKGSLTPFNFDPNTYTEEAVMDNPWYAIERAFLEWQGELNSAHPLKHKTFAQVAATAKPDILKHFSEQDLRELLLAIEPRLAVWKTIALIKKNPHALKHADFRALVERLLLLPSALNYALNSDPNLPQFLSEFFNSHIQAFKKQKDHHSALFLIHLMTNIQKIIKKPLDVDVAEDMQKWLEESANADSPLVNYRYMLLSYRVEKLGEKTSLNHAEMTEYVLQKNLWERMSPSVGYDALQADAIRKQYDCWQPQIQEALQDNQTPNALCQHILDTLCVKSQIVLSENSQWQGSYPLYHTDNCEVDLSTGNIVSLKNQTMSVKLPVDIARNPMFRAAFPDFDPNLQSVTVSKKNGVMQYRFSSPHGAEHLIEKGAEGLALFTASAETAALGAQYVAMDPEQRLQLGALGVNGKLYCSRGTDKTLLLYDRDGAPELKMGYKIKKDERIALTSIENINPKKGYRNGLQATIFDPEQHPAFKALAAFTDPTNVLLWSRDGKLQLIEIVDSGLTFEIQANLLVCTQGPLKGFSVDFVTHPPIAAIGLRLNPPQGSTAVAKWLVPAYSGAYTYQTDTPTFLQRVLAIIIKPLEVHVPALAVWRSWKFDLSKSTGKFWTFDIAASTQAVQLDQPEQNWRAYFDMIHYALKTCHIHTPEAIANLKYCLKAIREISPGKLTDQDLEQNVQAIVQNINIADASLEPIALALQALLEIRNKASITLRVAIGKQIAKWVPRYFAHSKHMHLQALLDPAQEKACLNLMAIHNPAWFFENVSPLLLEAAGTVQVPKKLNAKELTFLQAESHEAKPRKFIAPIDFEVTVSDFLEKQPAGANVQISQLNSIKSVAQAFKQLYTLASTNDFKQFKEIRAQLKKIAMKERAGVESEDLEAQRMKLTGGKIERTATTTTISYAHFDENAGPAGVLFDHLEAIFDIKAADGSLTLPFMLSANKKDMKDFVEKLSKFVQQHYQKIKDAEAPHVEEDVIIQSILKLIEELMRDPKMSVEEIDIVEFLEERLKAIAEPHTSKISVTDNNEGALYTHETLKSVFSETPADHGFDRLNLKALSSSDSGIGIEVRKMAGEIESLNAKNLKYHKLINKEKFNSIIADLEACAKKLLKENEDMKIAIQRLISPALTTKDALEKLSGYQQMVSWDELLIAFFQGDLAILENRIIGGNLRLNQIQIKLQIYLKQEVQRRYIDNLLTNELREVQQDPALLDSPATSERIYEFLTRTRSFDPSVHPDLLVMECLLGFLIRKDQMQMVSHFLEDSNAIQLAPTGAGKTSLILPLIALRKANGKNLVTLKFLDPLFPQNFQDIQKLLGQVANKKVKALLYATDTPLTHEYEMHGQKVSESIFKKMYEDALKVIVDKGCLITNKKSQPLLQAKMIEIYDRLSGLPGDQRPEMDLEHLEYLGKLLELFAEKEETVYDESDKFLTALEELHYRIADGKPLPGFVAQTTLAVFDHLLAQPELLLRQNVLAETVDTTHSVLFKTGERLSNEWASKKGLDPENTIFLQKYFLGILDEPQEKRLHQVLESHSKISAEERDQIALQKDLLLQFLTTTLTKTADRNYILSRIDGKSVVPADYADIPKEGSEHEDVRTRLCYLIQYLYQKGPSYAYFEQWVNALQAQATESLTSGEVSALEETIGEKTFKSYFPKHTLDKLSQVDIQKLHATIKDDPALVRKFLVVLTQELKLPGRKISLNPHNQVSIAKASAGTSATEGCQKGLHRRFNLVADKIDGNARMLARLLQRTERGESLLRYDPANPQTIIPNILKDDPTIHVVIDGAGVLRGMAENEAATQLLEGNNGKLSTVNYFTRSGKVQAVEDPKTKAGGHGQVYSHAQARGADRRLAVKHKAVLLGNGRSSLEEVQQNEGRLRKEAQKMRVAVPNNSPIKTMGDFINASLITQAYDNGNNLYLSKCQEMNDIVRSAQVRQLSRAAAQKDFKSGFKDYASFAQHGLLVSQFSENWEEPGSYYKAHKHLSRPQDPVKALEKVKDRFMDMAKQCDLPWVEPELEQLDFNKIKDYLPKSISGALDTNKEAQVETYQEVAVQTEVTTEVDVNVAVQKPHGLFYLPWGWKPGAGSTIFGEDEYKTINPAYDEKLRYTKRFIPVYRNNRQFPEAHHRQPHDPRQSRVHYVGFFQKDSEYYVNEHTTAFDSFDTIEMINKKPDDEYSEKLNEYREIVYDTKLNREIYHPNNQKPLDPKRRAERVAQLRFEDGQYSGYLEDEWNALKVWLQKQKDLSALEAYFVNEVLKHRPRDRERYQFSPLCKLFRELKHK